MSGFVGSRKTLLSSTLPVVADAVQMGNFPHGKFFVTITAEDAGGNIIADVALTPLIASITGATEYEKLILGGVIAGSSNLVAITAVIALNPFTSPNIVINLVPASGLVLFYFEFTA